MGMKCGIIGLPNVGKSTLFNALTESIAAETANYPFCTIEPNTGKIPVRDVRLEKIAKIAESEVVKFNLLEVTDIAGLVKGASQGEGLGNQFLANIRESDAILHMVRCFEDKDIIHVQNKIDPISDIELIETELRLADIASLESRIPNLARQAKKNKEDAELLKAVEIVLELLYRGKNASDSDIDPKVLKSMQIITSKPVIYVCNVEEKSAATGNDISKIVTSKFPKSLIISAKIESDIASLPLEERGMFMEEIGLEESGLNRLAKAGYELLGLQTFFTAGPKEARAWTIKKGASAPVAAGEIHSDIERGFIKAEIISWQDYIEYNGELECKKAGKCRQEGRDYIMKDGDVTNFKFNV